MTPPVIPQSWWPGHPLFGVEALPKPVHIDCQVKIWNDTTRKYVPLTTNTGVVVSIVDAMGGLPIYFTTDAVGNVHGDMTCIPLNDYVITFFVAGKTFGTRTYSHNYSITRTATYGATALELLPATLIISELIFPWYDAFAKAQDAAHSFDYKYRKSAAIKEFETTYDATNVNVLVEGDSWFDCLSAPYDLYNSATSYLTTGATKTTRPAKFLPLQQWGHTSTDMLDSWGMRSQFPFTIEYLTKYRFDLILLSCGGNDFALNLSTYFLSPLSPTLMADVKAIVLAHQLSLNVDFSGTYTEAADHVLNAVGTKFDDIVFPSLNSPPLDTVQLAYESIVALVFSADKVRIAFNTIEGRIGGLLHTMFVNNITTPVISHSYAYPIYSDDGVLFPSWVSQTNHFGEGPFLTPAFDDAGIESIVLRALCMKALIDAYTKHVLKKVKASSNRQFDFADIRGSAPTSFLWADEMHLNSAGYALASIPFYLKIREVCAPLFQP